MQNSCKPFFEVFPSIKMDDYYMNLYSNVFVEHVRYTKDRTCVNIYIDTDRLVEKKDIYHCQEQIEKQIFNNSGVNVRIMEHFHLSDQYTLAILMERYQESILLEIRKYSEIEYNLIRKATWNTVGESSVVILACDGPIMRARKDDITRHIEKILTERCGFDAKVVMELTQAPKKENKLTASSNQNHSNAAVGAGTYDQHSPVSRDTDTNRGTEGSDEFSQEQYYDKMYENYEAIHETSDAAIPDIPFDINPAEIFAADGVQEKSQSKPVENTVKTKEQSKSGKETGYTRKNGGKSNYRYAKSDDPNMIYGREVEGDILPISEIQDEIGTVVIKGRIMMTEQRPIRNEKIIFSFSVTDETDSIRGKIFISEEEKAEFSEAIAPGKYVIIKGIAAYDTYDKELEITRVLGMKKTDEQTSQREDHAEKKRVELHLHTKMSEFDGVSEISDMIKLAKSWGHTALAVTDHGCAYAFPQALHALKKDDPFKVIYGVEGYLVDDSKTLITNLFENTPQIDIKDTAVVFDLETTGLSAEKHKIIEFGAVKVKNGEIVERFSKFVNPNEPLSFHIENLTNITDEMLRNEAPIDVVLPQFLEFCSDAKFIVGHNVEFDVKFVKHYARTMGLDFKPVYMDTVSMARRLLPNLKRYKLDNVAKELGVSLENHHRAVDDAEATTGIFLRLADRLIEQSGYRTLNDIHKHVKITDEEIRKMNTYHIILLAKNDVGRVNLYRLISESHIKYFAKRPRMPKSLIEKYREGLIIGSACEAGELFQAILNGETEDVISEIAQFYDYLEIQPIGNNRFMIDEERFYVSCDEDLQDLNRQIVKLGETMKKPVVATCDVHFMNPEDEIYRRIIMAGQNYSDADRQPPLYLRTTDEMLEEFAYLGAEKAYEVVVENTNLISDMCENISPVRPDKCPPVIENSDTDLRNLCYENAHKMYGSNLPAVVSERLEHELNSIISNGFAVMYIIAQKLVKKSNDDGYLVGSRGSVGSSFVATMAGITEVNPLSPHYLCDECYYVDFDSEEVKAFSGCAGCDMPDRTCPVCGKKLTKQGFDIPFETFLGFKGNKEPDIDLNFSGEYQSKAHDYTEVIFGAGQTFRAGTIGTLADKTAYGYVKNYYEERGVTKRSCEIERIALGCTGVRRTTGQHPGGIIVLPFGEDICTFTPVQRPANDMTTLTVTTHFDYHSIDHNLLKLDILGHDDPTMIKMLEDLTCMDMKTVPLDDQGVMSLFMNTSALGIEPKDIMGTTKGALGIPEFGTDFAMGMLEDAKPTKFSDLIRIAGLSHGTDVWLGNAQTLIEQGIADISTAICTRDDIMIYLIGMGLESELSFTIMESVRKGKGLKPEWEEIMKEHNVPDWYIWSCKKIQYMFPKAHAAAYVMMAWRIAYCKIYYPLAYYSAFFSIRAKGFSYELMCMGKNKLEHHINDYKERENELTNKEQETFKDMRIVQEMYARGFEFTPIDLHLAKATRFQIVDGKIMPSFASIDGMGDNAAQSLEIAAAQGEFLSKDDLRERAKLTKTIIDKLSDLGLCKGLPESNQISLFDFVNM